MEREANGVTKERQRDQPTHGCRRDKARSRQSIGQQIGHQSRPQSVACLGAVVCLEDAIPNRHAGTRFRTNRGVGCFFARARSATLRVSSAPGDLVGATKRRVFLDDESTGDWLSKSASHLLCPSSPPERAHVTTYPHPAPLEQIQLPLLRLPSLFTLDSTLL